MIPASALNIEPPRKALATIGDAIQQRPAQPPLPVVVELKPEPEPAKRHRVSKSFKPHKTTPLGDAFRAIRLRRGLSQHDMAKRLDLGNSTLSAIELGDALPNDDLLLLFAEITDTALDQLIKLREDSQDDAVAPAPRAVPAIPTPAPSVVPAKSPPRFAGLAQLVSALDQVVPLPSDAAARGRWFELATGLYELQSSE